MLAKWLDAKYYESKHRPVPIQEYLVFDNSIYSISTSSAFFRTASQVNEGQPSIPLQPVRTICTSPHNEFRNPVTNAVVALAVETANHGYGALVFCSSRPTSEIIALVISEAMLNGNEETQDRRKDLLDELRSLPVGLDEKLEKTVTRGVAFHRKLIWYVPRAYSLTMRKDAGMTAEERETIANAYDRKIILVIVATCSLAAGINLPARRVILQGTRMGRDPIGPAML